MCWQGQELHRGETGKNATFQTWAKKEKGVSVCKMGVGEMDKDILQCPSLLKVSTQVGRCSF